MPVYVYETINEDGSGGARFEVVQSMKDERLATHPQSGKPVRRVLLPPLLGGKYSEAGIKNKIGDDKKLGEMGFTKYVRQGDGTYEKRAGSGPDMLNPHD